MSRIAYLEKLNQDSYTALAQDFDCTRQYAWTELEDTSRSRKDGDRILDLGCGNARLLKALPKVNLIYHGVDSNAYLLDRARKEYPGKRFTRARIEEVELEKEYYDAIFMAASLHHIVSHRKRLDLLHKAYRSLKPGGELIITVWNLWQQKYRRYWIKQWWRKVSWNDFLIPWKNKDGSLVWRYYHGFTKRGLCRLLCLAGFKVTDLTMYKDGQRVQSGYNIVVIAKK